MKSPTPFFRSFSIAIAFLFILLIPAGAQTWNAARDLRINEKPDEPDLHSTELSTPNARVPEWSYGYRGTLTDTALTLFEMPPDEHSNAAVHGNEDMEGWTKPGELWPLVTCNVSDAAVRPSPELKLLAPDELDVHPGTGFTSDAFAVVRWTAPSTGNYLISAIWRDIDLNCGDGFGAHIVRNGISIFDKSVPNGESTSFIRHILTLSAGDLVDFVVEPGPNGNQDCDSTALKIEVVLIPCATAE